MPFLIMGPLKGGDTAINGVLKETAEILRQNLSLVLLDVGPCTALFAGTLDERKSSTLVQIRLRKQLC